MVCKGIKVSTVMIIVIVLYIFSYLPLVGYSQTEDINTLIKELKDKDRSVRENAAKALGEIKDARAVEPLIIALKDNSPGVRHKAAEALGKIGDTRATNALMYASENDNDTGVRYIAAKALGKIKGLHPDKPLNKEYINVLIQQLRDENIIIRYKTESTLEMIGSPAGEPLIAALEDKDPCVRCRVISLLGKIKDPRAVEPLIAALKDPDLDVRGEAAYALGEINDIRAVEPLIVTLKNANTWLWDRVLTIMSKKFGTLAFKEPICTALNKYGDKSIAEKFLKSDNPLLWDAARNWAEKHGYEVVYEHRIAHPWFTDCRHTVSVPKLAPRSPQGEGK